MGKLMIASFTLSFLCWIGASFVPYTWLTLLLFGLAWVPIGGTNVIFFSAIQTIIPNQILGRVITVTTSISVVAMPIGSLAGGYMASQIGSQQVFSYTSFGILFISLVWLINPNLRRLSIISSLGEDDMMIKEKSG